MRPTGWCRGKTPHLRSYDDVADLSAPLDSEKANPCVPSRGGCCTTAAKFSTSHAMPLLSGKYLHYEPWGRCQSAARRPTQYWLPSKTPRIGPTAWTLYDKVPTHRSSHYPHCCGGAVSCPASALLINRRYPHSNQPTSLQN